MREFTFRRPDSRIVINIFTTLEYNIFEMSLQRSYRDFAAFVSIRLRFSWKIFLVSLNEKLHI